MEINIGLVIKFDKRSKTTSKKKKKKKKIDDDVMSQNCDIIAIFPIYGQLATIWKPNSGRIVCKTYFH